MTPARFGPIAQALLLVLLSTAPYVLAMNDYYVTDDSLTLLDARKVVGDPAAGFELGAFRRFRPLRLFSLGAVYALAGPENPVPYHILSLVLHVGNVLLAWLLMRRLTGVARMSPDGPARWAAFGAAAIFAVHWAASRAVVYISAIGLLFVGTGTFLACLGVLQMGDANNVPDPRQGFWRTLRPWAMFLGGLAMMIGGGEYCLGGLAPVICCAFWPKKFSPGRLSFRRGLGAGLLVLAVFAAYVIIQKTLVKADKLPGEYTLGAHVITQFAENLSRVFFPTTLLPKYVVPIAAVLLLGLAVAIDPRWRRRLFSPAGWLAALAAVGSLLAFAPTRMDNHHRFCYIACPFLFVWLLPLLRALLEQIDQRRAGRRPSKDVPGATPKYSLGCSPAPHPQAAPGCGTDPRGCDEAPSAPSRFLQRSCFAVVAVFVVVNGIYLNDEILGNRHHGQHTRALVSDIRQVVRDNPGKDIRLHFLGEDQEHVVPLLQLLDVLPRDHMNFHRPDASQPAGDELDIFVTYNGHKAGFRYAFSDQAKAPKQ